MNLGSINPGPNGIRYPNLVLNEDFKSPRFFDIAAPSAQTESPIKEVSDPAADLSLWYTAPPQTPLGNNTWKGALSGASPFSIGPDGLTITATRVDGQPWQSGLICSTSAGDNSKGWFIDPTKPFYLETVARWDMVPGVFPAIWLNTIGAIPAGQFGYEIDLVEGFGRAPTIYGSSTVHKRDSAGNDTRLPVFIYAPYPDPLRIPRYAQESFNAYGLEIDVPAIRFYLNRECYWAVPNPGLTMPLFYMADFAMQDPVPDYPVVLHMGIKSVQLFR